MLTRPDYSSNRVSNLHDRQHTSLTRALYRMGLSARVAQSLQRYGAILSHVSYESADA